MANFPFFAGGDGGPNRELLQQYSEGKKFKVKVSGLYLETNGFSIMIAITGNQSVYSENLGHALDR